MRLPNWSSSIAQEEAAAVFLRSFVRRSFPRRSGPSKLSSSEAIVCAPSLPQKRSSLERRSKRLVRALSPPRLHLQALGARVNVSVLIIFRREANMRTSFVTAASFGALLLTVPGSAQAQSKDADFFRGKTITYI